MPSPRRMRFLFVVVLAVVVGTLFFTSRLRETTADRGTVQDFYDKTINGIEDRHSRHPHARPPEANEKESPQHKDKKEKAGQQQRQRVLADKSSPPSKTTDEDKEQEDATEDRDDDGDVDEDDERLAREMKTRLRQAEKAAKDNANAKALKPDPPSEVIGVGNSAAGQPGRAQRKKKVDGAGKEKPTKTEETEDDEDEELESKIETELNSIFKRSPVIIFSKSYCQFSKRAKGILLEKYQIDPPPHVVELDQHPLGPKLQARLGEMTGRRTVPNIMVKGKSIGGSDDIAALDREKLLVDKIRELGGPRVSIRERLVADDQGKKDAKQ